MKYKISYTITVTDEDLDDTYNCDLEDFLWEHLRPSGDDWKVEEIEE